jgi:mRNA interferase RelE/StbE
MTKDPDKRSSKTTFEVYLTPTAKEMLDEIKLRDVGAHRKIVEKMKGLRNSPEKQGRALVGPLKGLRRIVAAGRYRILYRVQKEKVAVYVVATGVRREGDKRDIYEIAQKLIRAKLL